MTIEEVSAIWNDRWTRIKPWVKDGDIVPNTQDSSRPEWPDLWPGYAEAVRQRNGIIPHVMPGGFPAALFEAKAPNQTQKEMDWMRANYRQVTMPVYLDLENTVGRAMHPRNWSLDYDESPASELVKEYVEKGVKEWGSLFNFFRFAGTKLKISDAMGCLTFVPSSVDVIDSGDGVTVQDPDQEIRPEIMYFEVDRLLAFDYDSWYLLKLDQKSEVTDGNTVRRSGVMCWLIDDEAVWIIKQVGRRNEYRFEISEYYRHGLGYPPCINWMGTPSVKGSRLIWESPYLAVKDVLDTALLGEHWLRASEAKCVFPTTAVIGSPCEFIDAEHSAMCTGGTIRWSEEGIDRTRKCPQCNGSGWTPRLSPLGQVIINPDSQTTTGDGVNATNAVAFHSPPTDSVRYLKEQFDARIRYARSIMHLDAEAPMMGGDAKTATEAGLNARAKDAFVKPIADQMFVIFDFAIKCIGQQMVGTQWDGFSLRPPSNYDLRTDQDHLAEIASAMEKGLPPAIVDYLVWEYITSRYQNDPDAMAAFEVITKADRLSGMPLMAIQAEAAAGRVQPWEIYLHFAGMMLYEKEAMTEGWDALDIIARIERIQAAAKIAAQSTGGQSNNPLLRLADRLAA